MRLRKNWSILQHVDLVSHSLTNGLNDVANFKDGKRNASKLKVLRLYFRIRGIMQMKDLWSGVIMLRGDAKVH